MAAAAAASASVPPSAGVIDPHSKNVRGEIENLDGEPCDVMLVRVDPSSNVDEFLVIQLIRNRLSGGMAFVVYTRWGSTGTTGQALEQKFYSLPAAVACFENEFKMKTRSDWKDRDRVRAGPTVATNEYRFVRQNFAQKRAGFSNGLWQYWVDDGIDGKRTGWYDYTDSRQVERLYQEFLSNASLSQRYISGSSYFTYKVDFAHMNQTNVSHPNRTSRRIQRVNININGGAVNAPVAHPGPNYFGASAPQITHGAPPPSAPNHFHGASAPPQPRVQPTAPAYFMSTVRATIARTTGSSSATQMLKYKAPNCLSAGVPSDAISKPPPSCDMKDCCVICHDNLEDGPCVALSACNHVFHEECIQLAFKTKPQCPVCRVSIGKPQGKSPSGTMTVSLSPIRCSGFSENSIIIAYNLPSGIQRNYHEHPGKRHGGKNATAYLPNNADGQDLLKRLKYAWLHGLSFTVGTSFTTGRADQCTWASIHHKTSPSGGSQGHGYPDLDYFNNCNGELDGLGVLSAQELKDDGSAK